ncbi:MULTISPECIES: TonB-dependent receptor plug domain-containing protein [Alteromonas]|jgi:iron complex outermembrane receptor protein|uniref:TonB-dependent receptor plug domain-containing protein n=1 Tax=Alteromonas TaxID=226 RepID=UPI001278C045|nr:TonB-dependent receptor [Alteromonas macleodii]CAI2389307.1 iron complex outermembrane recepter protein [Alteromonas macleodii]CAI3942495.1 iron complex outermembrane recepter protein [Alteromonas macleodii]CAI3943466.1 iron complex outermembrane recepter protein [Alteromonas macleodii]CAI3943559.1 iron complex outermembrane recepter protein [Alteromonas macleodii]VTO38903.1 iron complex outermembrane recepter protein [Alteromonas macleodii]|tara:strand:- start:21252 stop:23840 length:2589 start_codon:yes stop_codon:yes gene_type:complete
MNTTLSLLTKNVRGVLAASAAFSVMAAAPVYAQEAEESAKAEDFEQIAVVGSRAAPRSVADSAVPIDIISDEEFKQQGATDMVSMMQTVVPSFNVNDQPINDASTLVRPANLRGMASDHTLVLVNGKRRHRSAVITFLGGGLSDGAQGPDISVIPAAALKQVEVLRDGAAAQYGSDAIAGVINFVLNDASEGGSFEARYGSFYEGDGDMIQMSGNVGLPLSDKGFINLSAEYRTADDTSRSVQRADAAALIAAGNTFVADPAQIWGSPEIKHDIKLFANAGIELSATSEAYMFGNYAEREVEGGFYFRNPHNRGGVNDGGTNEDGEQLLLVGDLTGDMSGNCPTDIVVGDNVLENPRYINEVQNNPDCWAFNEMLPGGFTPRFGGTVTDMSLVFGTKGELDHDITYDVSLNLGQNEVDFAISNTINPSLGPETPTEFSPGRYTQSEQTLDIDFTKPFDVGLYEPLFVATGFQYRNESYESFAGDTASYEIGPLATQGFGIGSNGFPGLAANSQGRVSRNNIALYIDAEAYITENFMLAGALRYEDFSDFGDTTKGKIAFRWQALENIAFRGAFSTGFKAPTLGQSNVRNVTTAFGTGGELIDRATLPPTDPVSQLKGGEQLTPEESESITFGVVADFDNGLFITADYYNIELTDRISTASGIALTEEDIATLLEQGINDASSFSEISFFTNDFDTTTEGVDVVANYSMDMMGGETKFSLAYNWTSTEVDRASDNISDFRIRMLEDNLPAVRYSATANHTNGDWRFLARMNYYGSIFEDHLDSALPIDKVGSEITFDFEVAYNFTEEFTVTVGAKNAFDEYPDENNTDAGGITYAQIAGSAYPTTSPIGINGGFYYLRGVYTF